MDNPKVTVLLATYNRGVVVGGIPLIERAIHSFLNQDYENSELIILDDASTDNTAELLRKYEGHPRITIHYGQVNKLPPNNWNWLWEQVPVDTDLICQLHDDDELTASSLSDRVRLFTDKLQVVYGGVIAQNMDKTSTVTYEGQAPSLDRIWKEEYINFTTLMYRRDLTFRFDTTLRYYFDWLFKIRCLTECKCDYFAGPVMRYTTHQGQETNKCRRENMNAVEEGRMRHKLEEIYG